MPVQVPAVALRVWPATGKDDFLLPDTEAALTVFDRHGLRHTYRETDGGHPWPTWHAYRREFAPLLSRRPGADGPCCAGTAGAS